MSDRIYYSSEAELRARHERAMLAIIVAGLSLSIGTLLALLFAPRSGDETRHQLNEQMNQTVAQGRQAAETAAQQLLKNADKLRDNLEERLRVVSE